MNHQVYTENLFWNKKNSVKCFLHLNSKMKDLETAEMLQEWILQALLTQIVILYDYTYDIMVRFGFRWFPLLWDFLIPKLKDQTLPWKDKRENITHCYQDCHWCLLRQNLSYMYSTRLWMIKGTYLSKSEKMFTWRVCCLSSLYPFAILTASLAWRGEVYSMKTYLKERECTHFKNIYRAMLSLQTVFRRLYGWKARTYISTLHFIIFKNNFLPFFKED